MTIPEVLEKIKFFTLNLLKERGLPHAKLLCIGITGSKAYNLGKESSDYDFIGVFSAHPTSLFGLHYPAENVTSSNPYDITLFEARKFCGLALKGNMRFVI
jgi:predicted nucleotidyltransferase